MNLAEFREMINEMAEEYPDAEVIIAKDGEGNVYSPLDSCSIGMYLPENTWYGSFVTEEENEENEDDDSEEYEENAIVLWPMN